MPDVSAVRSSSCCPSAESGMRSPVLMSASPGPTEWGLTSKGLVVPCSAAEIPSMRLNRGDERGLLGFLKGGWPSPSLTYVHPGTESPQLRKEPYSQNHPAPTLDPPCLLQSRYIIILGSIPKGVCPIGEVVVFFLYLHFLSLGLNFHSQPCISPR